MAQVPAYLGRLNVQKFSDYLKARGAEILITTNAYEVLRMRCANGTHVIYRKENNQLTWPDELIKAYKGFTGGQWSAGTQTRRRTRSVSPIIRTVMDRDGCECFYCGLILDGSTATLEHFVALAHGGPNHISNYVLACKEHNLEAGHLSSAEKVKMRDRIRESGKIRRFIIGLRKSTHA